MGKLSILLLVILLGPMIHLPMASASPQWPGYHQLVIKAWTDEDHRELRALVDVYCQGGFLWYGGWYWRVVTPAVIYVPDRVRVHVFLIEDPPCHGDLFLFWDNYGIARGPDGQRSWYLDVIGDRIIAATYRKRADLDYSSEPWYYQLVVRAWTEEHHCELRARVEVSYEAIDGRWVEYQSVWTPAIILVRRCSRAYVFLREDPPFEDQFLYWDNYGIARGPQGDRNWYLDMTGDRTMVATYR